MTRSPTAESLFEASMRYEAKSAGLGPVAVQKVFQDLIDWADKIFVMSERKDRHITQLKENFNISDREIIDLDIDDIYEKNDPILVQILKDKLSKHGIKI